MRRSGRLQRGKALRRVSARVRRGIQAHLDWVRAVKERDSGCQFPGCAETRCRLELHHVYPKGKWPDLRLAPENGLLLCSTHHRRWHGSSRRWREWWAERWPEREAALQSLTGLGKNGVGRVPQENLVDEAVEDRLPARLGSVPENTPRSGER